jgi:hypothetical protein
MELQGDMYIEPEGGSTQPENVPQDRQDATVAVERFSGQPDGGSADAVPLLLQKMG